MKRSGETTEGVEMRPFLSGMSFWDVLHTFGPDYKVIVVGDASMSPHEITMKGGSVEHYNDEPGTNWLSRLLQHYQKTVWLNPLPIDEWKYGQSIQMTN